MKPPAAHPSSKNKPIMERKQGSPPGGTGINKPMKPAVKNKAIKGDKG